MDISTITNLLIFVILILLTIIFVGSEFSLVKARQSRIDQLIEDGNNAAVRVKKMTNELDYYLSACQLGITVTALGLGWIGESTFEVILHPFFDFIGLPDNLETVFTVATAFAIVTFLHVVVGELAPKTVAIHYAEKLAMMFSLPLYIFGVVLKPFIFVLNGASRLLLRILGFKDAPLDQGHSEEELKIIMTQSYQSGEINQQELAYMQNIFSFDERLAKDIMVPRTQMITLTEPITAEDVLAVVQEHNFTRYPITGSDGDKDNIIGYINVREYLTQHLATNGNVRPEDYTHEMPLVTEVSRISDALIKMQRERVHISLIIDEYGGTAGMLAMEDILEEIVGEIRDEFDEDEEPDVVKVDDDVFHISGRVLLSDLEEQFDVEFKDSEEIDTIGGWIRSMNSEIEVDDSIDTEKDRWIVLELDNHLVKQVALHRNYNNNNIEVIED
ncbi:hemolysin family protein [Aliicoccus persicus]|uniref:Hemolysin, contains CBS domains n=1 Tax=Aliicoccus persicus TaxID=930138 RepID=A0A662Z4Z7_9STAP|nr:hemolysin family protein [Aliicoccus persicus]SEV99913.1 Hemolysin, contains CBS domains [Aliicoccus persicus]